jgi:hypothetical protein
MTAFAAYPATLPTVEWRKACGRCRRSYEYASWRDLPECATLPPARVQPYLSVPAQWTVEIRRCTCGALLAARSQI